MELKTRGARSRGGSVRGERGDERTGAVAHPVALVAVHQVDVLRVDREGGAPQATDGKVDEHVAVLGGDLRTGLDGVRRHGDLVVDGALADRGRAAAAAAAATGVLACADRQAPVRTLSNAWPGQPPPHRRESNWIALPPDCAEAVGVGGRRAGGVIRGGGLWRRIM